MTDFIHHFNKIWKNICFIIEQISSNSVLKWHFHKEDLKVSKKNALKLKQIIPGIS